MPKRDLEQFMAEARRRFDLAVEAEADDRREAELDLAFFAGQQWDEKLKRDREADGRPAFTFNKLTGPVQQVANDSRRNKPQIKIIPKAGGATAEKAKLRQGMIRHIQYQ